MALSNSIDFTQNVESLIRDALYYINALGVDEAIPAEKYQIALRQLNRLIKRWQSHGISIWAYQQSFLFLQQNQVEYILDGATDNYTNEFVGTEISVAKTTGATGIEVDSTTGMAVNDNIGIELDSGSRFWTTIDAVNSSTLVTVATGIPSDIAVDNTVFVYTDKAKWPLDLNVVRYYDYDSQINRPITRLTRREFFDIPDVEFNQVTSGWFYDKGNRSGILHIWPRPSEDPSDYIKVTAQRVLNDADDLDDDLDFPAEYLDALILNLAILLCHPFKKKASDDLRVDAKVALDEAKRLDNEPQYLEVSIDCEH